MKTLWLCEKHYQELCKKVGYEVAIYTIYNAFRNKCQADGCEEIAKHLVDDLVKTDG
jgi:hypothetical protein